MTTLQPAYQYADGRPHRIQCPSKTHGGDRDASNCHVHMVRDGEWELKCWSHLCLWKDIAEGLGLRTKLPGRKWEPTQVTYFDHPDGNPRIEERYEYPESFPSGKPCPWRERGASVECSGTTPHKHFSGKGSPRGSFVRLFGSDNEDNAVVLVEGPKAAASLVQAGANEAGYTPASWRGGHATVKDINFSSIRGRMVVLWPDANAIDPKKGVSVGLAAMVTAAEKCRAVEVEVLRGVEVDIPPSKGLPGLIQQRFAVPDGGDAADLSPSDRIAVLIAADEYSPPAPPPIEIGLNGVGPASLREWYHFGVWYSRHHLEGRYRYVTTPGEIGWWHYDGRKWWTIGLDDPRLLDRLSEAREGIVTELSTQGHAELSQLLNSATRFQSAKPRTSDMWAALRNTLSGDTPKPKFYHLGVPSGVVDLRTGQLLPHSSKYEIRGVASGDYRPNDLDELSAVFHQRFDKVFPPITQRAYLQLIGLAMTRRAQSYRPLVMVIGASGSGKGDATNVAVRALGDLAMSVAPEWLSVVGRSEIDITTTELLESQAALLKVDEVGVETQVGVSRLLSLTGNTRRTARRPHGPLVKDYIVAMIWTTAVSPPRLSTGGGMRRRLAVLSTLRQLEEAEVDEEGGNQQDLLDAVVTMAVREAMAFYRPGYRAPEGDVERKREVLAEMDDVADWLDAQSELHNKPVAEARELAQQYLEREISDTAFGRKISDSIRWKRGRYRGQRVVQMRSESSAQLWNREQDLTGLQNGQVTAVSAENPFPSMCTIEGGGSIDTYGSDLPTPPNLSNVAPGGAVSVMLEDGRLGCGRCGQPLEEVPDGVVCAYCGAWWEGDSGLEPGTQPTLEGQS